MNYVRLKDIAKISGFSINTVSRAINGKPDVNEKTRKKVLETAQKLGYVPNRWALSLKTKKTHIIGVLIEDNTNPFWAEILKGVEIEAKEKDYNIIIINTGRSYKNEVEGLKTLIERRVDGLLIAPTQEKYDDIYEIIRMKIPFVIVGRHIKEFEKFKIPMIYSDEIKGGYLATKHLIDRKCKKIVFIGAQSYNSASKERFLGYKKALVKANININETLIKNNGIEIDGGYKSTIELINDQIKFDGVFAYNDLMAFGVIKALKEKKIKIPEEVKIIGYDDISFSSLITPNLTTMQVKKLEMGKNSFKLLINEDKKEKYKFQPQIIIREST